MSCPRRQPRRKVTSQHWPRLQAKQLTEKLEGCSLYIVGFGPRRAAIGRLLSRRLARYRFYDVEELMCSTYAQLAGGQCRAAPARTISIPHTSRACRRRLAAKPQRALCKGAAE